MEPWSDRVCNRSGEAPWDQDSELSELVATYKEEVQRQHRRGRAYRVERAHLFVVYSRAIAACRRLSASQALDDPWLLPRPLDERKPPPAPAPAPAVPPPPQEEEEPPAAAATSALLEAAADELESMRERLRRARCAERAAEKASEALQLEMEAMKEEAEALEAEVFMAAAMRMRMLHACSLRLAMRRHRLTTRHAVRIAWRRPRRRRCMLSRWLRRS